MSIILLCDPADIDECALSTHKCEQNCHNTAGSYACSCNTGYQLNADEHHCDGNILYLVATFTPIGEVCYCGKIPPPG